jgi:hypothetical protein
VNATATDHDAIVEVVQLYIQGFNDGDVAKFKEAFHEDAWIFVTDADGTLHRQLLTDYFEAWAALRANIVGRVISVQQAGDLAGVLLGFDNVTDPSRSWVDFHTLLRIDGVWKITNKTATHCSRAGRAGDESSQHRHEQAPAEGGQILA